MSRWNHPAYNWADKAVVVAIVTVFITVYAAATGAPVTASLVGMAGLCAVVAGVIVTGLLRAGAGAES